MYTTMTMGVANTVHYFYPKLIPVVGPKGGLDDPQPVRCSRDKLSEDSAYLLGKFKYKLVIIYWHDM